MGGVTEKLNGMFPMDRVQLSQNCQVLSPQQFLVLILSTPGGRKFE